MQDNKLRLGSPTGHIFDGKELLSLLPKEEQVEKLNLDQLFFQFEEIDNPSSKPFYVPLSSLLECVMFAEEIKENGISLNEEEDDEIEL